MDDSCSSAVYACFQYVTTANFLTKPIIIYLLICSTRTVLELGTKPFSAVQL